MIFTKAENWPPNILKSYNNMLKNYVFVIARIIKELQDVLANRNPEVKPKDDFKKNIQITGTSM